MNYEDKLDKLLKAYDKAYYEGRPEQAVLLKEQIEKLFDIFVKKQYNIYRK